ncbi:MAG: hypothetical protein V4654_14960 [Bdellovibrionota bacterium]
MRLFFTLVWLCALSVLAAEPKAAGGDYIADIEQRIIDLEQRQKDMREWYENFYILGKGRVTPFLGNALSIGGFFESAVTHLYGPDIKTQTSGNIHTLGLNIAAQFNEKTKFVTQTWTRLVIPLANTNPNLTPPQSGFEEYRFFSIVVQGYLEYRVSDFFIVQSGLGYTPYGIVAQQREPQLFRLRGGSQTIAYDDGDTIGIFSPLWTGLHFLGILPINHNLGYNLYTFTPLNQVSTLGIGARLWYKLSDKATVGTSVQSGEQRKGSFFSHGFDVDLKYKDYGFVSEYGHTTNSGDVPDAEFYYFEPYVKFAEDRWLFFLNAEYIDTLERTDFATHIPDPVKKWQHGGGFNWLPISNARLRLTYLYHDYIDEADMISGQERDYNTIDFSTAVAF